MLNLVYPQVLIKKKDGSRRFWVDYQRFNMFKESDANSMPDLHEMVRGMGVAKIYSAIYLKSGYWQVGFSLVLTFRPNNFPTTFCRLVSEVFRGLVGTFLLVYLDDIMVNLESPDQHLHHL